MQIQINTDHHIEGHEALVAWATGEVGTALSHHKGHITRVEVHLSDANGHKSGQNDKHCVMEGRLEGRQPMAVTHNAQTLYQAVTGAADKLNRLIESTLGRAARSDASPRTDLTPPEPADQA
jgi:ribosome-associated translation inhibitor RaiA